MKILVTGGAGYIGSHTCLALLNAGYEVVVIDNFTNSSIESINRLEILSNKKINFYEEDVRNKSKLIDIFTNNSIDFVMHFAGLKSVYESVQNPLDYYDNNVSSVIVLCDVMKQFNCKTLVFSSSATVYGDPDVVPIKEDSPLSANNPYGYSKLIIEGILQDLYISDDSWRIAILRYFNPVGAHKTGFIGEDPKGNPNNLFPYILQVAIGRRKKLSIFGGDYDTHDGTGVRDYIHILDLVEGHINALEALSEKMNMLTVNLGTGKGYSVLEVVKTFEKVTGKRVPYEIINRREGDIANSFADSNLAAQLINWKTQHTLKEMCEDAWRWQKMNPEGYIKKL